MLKVFYSRIVIQHPYLVLILVLFAVSLISSQAFKIKIDASAETLLLKDDNDLAFSRKVNSNYYNPDFLVVTYSPKKGQLLDDAVLKDIEELSSEIKQLDLVDRVFSLLNAPLLQAPHQPLAKLLEDVPTIKSTKANNKQIRDEFLSSPVYQQNLVSDDFTTTAIQVFYKRDQRYFDLLDKRNTFLEKKNNHGIVASDKKILEQTEIELTNHRDLFREKNHQTIKDVRAILLSHQGNAELFLGGINMVADDMVTFIRDDLKIYGSALIILLMIILYIIFRQLRFVVIPMSIALLSIAVTAGLLGYFGWEVTVISSNFISIQLIMTMSLAIHLCVKYRELVTLKNEVSRKDIVLETTLSMIKPCFFVVITTITGFSSLAVSNILPVMNFGWMMSAGVAISFIIAFLVFPASMALLKQQPLYTNFEKQIKLTEFLGNIAVKYPIPIIATCIVLIIFNGSGASRLIVENSFINYFKSDSEIYQGMKVIDTDLGGTTPLDIVIDFPIDDDGSQSLNQKSELDPLFAEFESELKAESDEPKYWFTEIKMKKLEAVHNYLDSLEYTGKVLSFATMLKLGQLINDGESLDNLELALIYNEMPKKFRDITIDPFLDLENNQVRFSTRIIDSNKNLRRDALLKKIKRELPIEANLEPGNVHLAGMMVLYNNMLQSLFDSQIKTLGLVVLILSFMFLILFKSIKIALIAMITNIISVSSVFGLMGWLGIPLDMMTITIAAIAMGIAVDDTVHYIHRYKIELKKTGDHLEAIQRSHSSIGHAILYTTLTIVIGFSLLTLSNFIPTVYFGLLTVIAMIMALIADLLLLPVLLNWIKPFRLN